MIDKVSLIEKADATVLRGSGLKELLSLTGKYFVKCVRPDGLVRWEDTIDNLVTTAGKNLALDTLLAGSSYSVTGPYMGLISSVSWSAVNAADTMSSHSGWYEAGYSTYYPLYNGNRKTCVWSAASGGSKALSAALSFVIETTGGTVKGCFIVLGASASATINNTSGTLYSCGTFSGGDKVVGVGDTLQISYTAGA